MKAQSERFMRDCGYRGILAIEYFIKGGEIYFNEMAPRPHNSGHYTIEGCDHEPVPRTGPLSWSGSLCRSRSRWLPR